MLSGYQSFNQTRVFSSSGQLVKAKLKPIDSNVEEIEFQFNPESLSFDRRNDLSPNDSEGRDSDGLRKISYAGPQPIKLSINKIIFDTFEQDNVSVLTYINKLNKALDAIVIDNQSNGQKRPPIYIFIWGSNQYLRCFVESLSYQITMFMPDGRPVRAEARLSLQQVGKDGIVVVQKQTQQPNTNKK